MAERPSIVVLSISTWIFAGIKDFSHSGPMSSTRE